MYIGTARIRSYEKGLLFKKREFRKIVGAGRQWFADPSGGGRLETVSMREPWLEHPDLDLMVRSGALDNLARVLELADHQRALVWIDNRFARILGPGQYALWLGQHEVRVEIIDAGGVRFEHPERNAILEAELADRELTLLQIDDGKKGVYFLDGVLKELLPPGRHLFWRRMGQVKVLQVEVRESVLDVSGQEIMTRDKVSLRLNGVVTFRVADPVMAVSEVENHEQALYRETQLALRAAVGTTELDALLADKTSLAEQVREMLVNRAQRYGVRVASFGIRDIILPGEMKELLNRVVEAKKAAEANLISRREETAAMRNQANTARLLAGNPTLMRLRELEVLEKVATGANLSLVCGDGNLAQKVIKLI